MDQKIELKLAQWAEQTIHVDRERYEQAKADGTLYRLLDRHVSGLEFKTTVTEPDGTEFDPFA